MQQYPLFENENANLQLFHIVVIPLFDTISLSSFKKEGGLGNVNGSTTIPFNGHTIETNLDRNSPLMIWL